MIIKGFKIKIKVHLIILTNVLFFNSVFSQSYYKENQVDVKPEYGDSKNEFISDILFNLNVNELTTCSPGNHTINFTVSVGFSSLLEGKGVKEIDFKGQYCSELQSSLRSIILDLNNKSKWKLAKIYKKRDLNDNIPYIKNKSTSEGKYFLVPAETNFSIEINIPESLNYENDDISFDGKYQESMESEVNYHNNDNETSFNEEAYPELDELDYAYGDDNYEDENSENNNFQIKRNNYSIPGLLVIFFILITIILGIYNNRQNKYKKQELEALQRKNKEQAARRIKQAELEKKRKIEAEKKRKIEAEKKRKAELEKKKLEAEEKRKAEEENKKKREVEQKKKKEIERKKRLEEEKKEEQIRIENNSYYYEIEVNNKKVVKGPFTKEEINNLLSNNEITLLTKVKFGLHKKTFKQLKKFPEFTSGFEDFL